MRLVGVRVETPDTAAASERYAALLGVEPLVRADGARRFVLERGLVELAAGEPGRATVLFARERTDDAWPADPEAHGLRVGVDERPDAPSAHRVPDAVEAIDHVVIFTTDAARSIALWGDALGLRLAFDKAFPARHVRLVFFRSGGLTFELASPLPETPQPAAAERFHGISYRVRDLAARRAALVAAGFDVSEIRTGHKAGTRVATVRSGTADVPTLLLEPEAAP